MADKETQNRKADESLDSDMPEIPSLDDISLDEPQDGGGTTGSNGKRKPVSPTTKAVVETLKGVGAGIKSATTYEMAKAMPNAAATATEVKRTYEDLKALKDELAQQLGPMMVSLETSGRKLLPKAQKFLPKKLYDKIQKKLDARAADRKMMAGTSVSKEQMERDMIASEISEIFAAQTELQMKQFADTKQVQLLDKAIGSTRHKQTTAQLVHLYDAVRGTELFHKTQHLAYMKKSLELKYKHLFVARDTFNLLSSSMATFEGYFKALVQNTKLPDMVKVQMGDYYHKSRTEKYGTMMSDFLSNMRGEIFKKLKAAARDGIDQMSTAVDSLDFAAEMGAMSDEFGSEKKNKPSPLWKLGGMGLGWILGGPQAKDMLDRVRPFTRDFDKSMKNLRGNAALKAANLKRKWSYGNAFQQMIAGLLPEGFTPQESASNELLSKPHDPATFDVITRQSIVEIIPGFLGKILNSIDKIRTGDENTEEMAYNVYARKFTTVSDYKTDMMTKMYGTEQQRRKLLAPMLGNLQAGIEHNTGEEGESRIKGYEKDLNKVFFNYAWRGELFEPEKLRKFIMAEDKERALRDPHIAKIFNGIEHDPVEVAKILYDSVFTTDGTIDKRMVEEIDSALRSYRELDTYKTELPRTFETYGQRHLFASTLNARDEQMLRAAARNGNKQAEAVLRKQGGLIGDDNRINFSNMIEGAADIDYSIGNVSDRDYAHHEVAKSLRQSDRDRAVIAKFADKIRGNKVVAGALGSAAVVAKGGKAVKDFFGRAFDDLYDYYQDSRVKSLGDRLAESAVAWKDSALTGLKQSGVVVGKGEEGKRLTPQEEHEQMMKEWDAANKRAEAEAQVISARSSDRIAKMYENMLSGHMPPMSGVSRTPPPPIPASAVLNTVMPMTGIGAGSRERGGVGIRMPAAGGSEDDDGGAGGVLASGSTSDILQKFYDLYKYNEDFRTEQLDDWKKYVSEEHNLIFDWLTNWKEYSSEENGLLFDALAQIDESIKAGGIGGGGSPAVAAAGGSTDPRYNAWKRRRELLFKGAKAIGRGVKGTVKGVGKVYTRIYGSALEGAGTAIKGLSELAGKGLEKAEKVGKWLVAKQQYVDVYRKSDHKLLVSARQQREDGIFFAGSMKRVERSSDITEPCLDKNAEYIITKEDLADGLVMNDSSPLGKVGAGLLSLGKGYLGLYGAAISAIGKIGKAVVQGFVGKVFDKYCDIYIKGKGKDKPVLTRLKQSRDPGVFFKNGKRVERSSDIREPVYDPTEKDAAGQPLVLISEDDLKEGLVDVNDKPLGTGMGGSTGIMGKMLDIGKSFGEIAGKGALKGMDLYSYIYKNLFDLGIKGIKGIGKGVGKFLGGGIGAFVGYDEESKTALFSIRDALIKIQADVATLAGSDKKIAGDLDGDGDVDGSYADQQQKKAAEGTAEKSKRVQASDIKHTFHNWRAEAGSSGDESESGGGLMDLFGKVRGLFGGGAGGEGKGLNIPGLGKLGGLLGKGGGKLAGALGSLGRGISGGGGRFGTMLSTIGAGLKGTGGKGAAGAVAGAAGGLGKFFRSKAWAGDNATEGPLGFWTGTSNWAQNAWRNMDNPDDNFGTRWGKKIGRNVRKGLNKNYLGFKKVANAFSKDNLLKAGRSVADIGRQIGGSKVGMAAKAAGQGIGKLWGAPVKLASRGLLGLGKGAAGVGAKAAGGIAAKVGGAAGLKAGAAMLGSKAAGLATTLGANLSGLGSGLAGTLSSVGLGPLAAGAAALYGGYRMTKGFTAKETMDNLGIKDERDVLFEDRLASALGFNTKIGAKAMRGLQSVNPLIGLIKGIRGNDNPMTEKEVEQGRTKLQHKVNKGLPGYDKILSSYEKAVEDHNWSRARQLCGKEADGIIASMWKHSITGKVVTGLGNLFFGKKDEEMTKVEIEKVRAKYKSLMEKGGSAAKNAERLLNKFDDYVAEGDWKSARKLANMEKRGLLGKLFQNSDGSIKWGSAIGSVFGPVGLLVGSLFNKADVNKPMSEEEVKKARERLQKMIDNGNPGAQRILDKFDEYVTQMNWRKARQLVGEDVRSNLEKLDRGLKSTAKWVTRIGTLGLSTLFEQSQDNPMTEQEIKKFTDKMNFLIEKHNDKLAKKKLDKFEDAVAAQDWEKARKIAKMPHRSMALRAAKAVTSFFFGNDEKEMTEQEMTKFRDSMNRKIEIGGAIGRAAQKKLDAFEDAVGAQRWKRARAIAKSPDDGLVQKIGKGIGGAVANSWRFVFGGDGKPMSEGEITAARKEFEWAVSDGKKNAQKRLDLFNDYVADEKWEKARRLAKMPYENVAKRSFKAIGNWLFGDDKEALTPQEIDKFQKECEQKIADAGGNDPKTEKILDKFNEYVAAERWEKARAISQLKAGGAWGSVKKGLKSAWDWIAGNSNYEDCIKMKEEIEEKAIDDESGIINKGLEQFETLVRRQKYNEAYDLGKDLLKMKPAEIATKHKFSTEEFEKITKEGNELRDKIDQAIKKESHFYPTMKEMQLRAIRNKLVSNPGDWSHEYLDDIREKLADITGQDEFADIDAADDKTAKKGQQLVDDITKTSDNFSWFGSPLIKRKLSSLKNEVESDPSTWDDTTFNEWRARLREIAGEDAVDSRSAEAKNADEVANAEVEEEHLINDGTPEDLKSTVAAVGQSPGSVPMVTLRDGSKVPQKNLVFYGEDALVSRPWLQKVQTPGDQDDEQKALSNYKAETKSVAEDISAAIVKPSVPVNSVPVSVSAPVTTPKPVPLVTLADGSKVSKKLLDYYGEDRLVKEPWLKDVDFPGDPDDEAEAKEAYDLESDSQFAKGGFVKKFAKGGFFDEYLPAEYKGGKISYETYMNAKDEASTSDKGIGTSSYAKLTSVPIVRMPDGRVLPLTGELGKALTLTDEMRQSLTSGEKEDVSESVVSNHGYDSDFLSLVRGENKFRLREVEGMSEADYENRVNEAILKILKDRYQEGKKLAKGGFATTDTPAVDADGNPILYGEAGTEAIMPIKNKPGNLLSRVSNKVGDILFGKGVGPMKDTASVASVHAGTEEAEPMENMMANEIAKSVKSRMESGGFVRDLSLLTRPTPEDTEVPVVPNPTVSMASSAAKLSEAVDGFRSASTPGSMPVSNTEMLKKLSEMAASNKRLIEMLSAVLSKEGIKVQGMDTLTEVCAIPQPAPVHTTQIIHAGVGEDSGLDLRKRQA